MASSSPSSSNVEIWECHFRERHSWFPYDLELCKKFSEAKARGETQFQFSVFNHKTDAVTQFSLDFTPQPDGSFMQTNLLTGFKRPVRVRSVVAATTSTAPDTAAVDAGLSRVHWSAVDPAMVDSQDGKAELDDCAICLSPLDKAVQVVQLKRCHHAFHEPCIAGCVKVHKGSAFFKCPVCNAQYGVLEGDQPNGRMGVMVHPVGTMPLSGHEDCGTIVIDYSFRGGIQSASHPHPGAHHSGTHRTAYLPDSAEGREVLALLKVAWARRMLFTIGQSVTSGGPANHGYPDPAYLQRVTHELAARGVVGSASDGGADGSGSGGGDGIDSHGGADGSTHTSS